MSYNYEASLWGRGTASSKISDPTAFRFKTSLKAIKNLPSGASVLEVGCGAGQFIRGVHKARPELSCFGSDISRAAIQSARSFGDGVTYVLQEPDHLPYEDGAFAAVLVYDVLEHVEEPEIFLKEVRRVLAPGALLYAFVPCEGDKFSLWNLLRKFHIGEDLTKKHAGHIQRFTRASLLSLLKNNAFNIDEIVYSEHILGQLLGVFAFFGMERAVRRTDKEQINNETYFQSSKNNAIIGFLKGLVNSCVYLESELLHRIPSPNIHIVGRKA